MKLHIPWCTALLLRDRSNFQGTQMQQCLVTGAVWRQSFPSGV